MDDDDYAGQCKSYLDEMRKYERLTPERYAELERFLKEKGGTRQCHNFMLFFRDSTIQNPFQNFDGVTVPQLFERYEEWPHLRDVLSEVYRAVAERLIDFRGNVYFEKLGSAIDDQFFREFSSAFHENRLNNEELTQLIDALRVILVILNTNLQDVAPRLYLLNNTMFHEHILVRGNPILNDLLEPLRREMRHENPEWLRSLKEDHEFRMGHLESIKQQLLQLQEATGTVLDLVDTRIPVIPPPAAQLFLDKSLDECTISREELRSLPAEDKVVLSCGHGFKKICIHRWFKETGIKCPVCGQRNVMINPAHEGTTRRPTHIPHQGIARVLLDKEHKKGKAFSEAVVLNCGDIFDKSEIDRRKAAGHKTCPVCGTPITQITTLNGGSRKCKKNSRRKSKKSIKRKKTIKRRKNNTSRR